MANIRPLHLILGLIALVAIVLPLAVIRFSPRAPRVVSIDIPKRVVRKNELPMVEPLKLVDLAPEDARGVNDAVPFVDGPIPPARPFRFLGGADDLARATDCLAAAVYYEAGDDAVGEQAVAQVILNRLRHPAFPKTVCGVVFQGSERSTGCQFTFTCDGALNRRPSETAWTRARQIAGQALGGFVYKDVGLATHYHTDWVVPYWSASLDKIAEVHTHLFFRWTGWWGTPAAFNRGQAGGEYPIGKMAALSDAHRMGAALADADGAIVEAQPFFGSLPLPLPSDRDTFLTSLNPAQAATFQSLAAAACGPRAKCKFMGWTDPENMGFRLPMSDLQMAAMSFSYIRDTASGLDRTLWNCQEFKGKSPCMKRRFIPRPPPSDDDALDLPPLVATRGPAELSGVRRKPIPVDAADNASAVD